MSQRSFFAALTLTVAGAGLVSAGTAVAGSDLCDNNYGCIYDENDFVGLIGKKAGGAGMSNVPPSVNDSMESWENKATISGCWYEHANGGGTQFDLPAESEDNNLGWTLADELSSWRMSGICYT